MIAFKVNSFSRLACETALRRLFNDHLAALPSHFVDRLYGQSGRFVWIPDGPTPKYTKNEILDDIRNKGELYREILQNLLEEIE